MSLVQINLSGLTTVSQAREALKHSSLLKHGPRSCVVDKKRPVNPYSKGLCT